MNRRTKIEGKNKNISRAFILPMCGINYKTLPKNFNNCYITLDYDVILVFNREEYYDTVFYHFVEHVKSSLKSYRSYEEDIDEILIFFKVPEVFRENFDLFIEGKYSKLTDGYKDIIISFYGKKTIKDSYEVTAFDMIEPTDYKRKQIAEYLSSERSIIDWRDIDEVFSKPNLKKEIYKPLTILLAENIQF